MILVLTGNNRLRDLKGQSTETLNKKLEFEWQGSLMSVMDHGNRVSINFSKHSNMSQILPSVGVNFALTMN